MSDKSGKRQSSSKQFKTSEEEYFQTFCKQMLEARAFKGCYQERRYVENLNKYRDLIVIDKEENELIKALEYLKQRINNNYGNEKLWIGITLPNMIGAPAAGVCIWSEITDIPLGEHWFFIKSLKFRDDEVIIKLTKVRSEEDVAGSFTRTTQNVNNQNDKNNDIPTLDDFIGLFHSWKNSVSSTVFTFLSRDINLNNITSTLKFLTLLIISLLTFSIEAIKYIGIFSLKFMAELRLWIGTCTPIILKIIELIGKIIGGFYILLAMLWRDVRGNPDRGNINYNRMLPPTNSDPRYITSGGEYYRNLHNGPSTGNRRNVF